MKNSNKSLGFVDPPKELIDLIWIDGRPQKGDGEISIHDVIHAGMFVAVGTNKVI